MINKTFYFIVSLFVLFTFGLTVCAQSMMSDEQVMQFVLEENNKGTVPNEIVIKLSQKGVDLEQIKRVRKKYSEQQAGLTTLGKDELRTTEANSRLRTNKNGKETKAKAKAKGTSTQKQQEQEAFYDEIAGMLPDTSSISIIEEAPGKVIFGHNIFSQEMLSFEPNMNISSPEDYTLGAGDGVYIDIWGASQKTIEAEISPEGSIEVSGYGPIQLAGLTIAEANKRLRSTLGERYANSEMRLTLGQTRSITINVMGEVVAPGTYTVSAFATVFHALYMAGGVNEIGTLRNIEVWRKGKKMTSVDIYDFILGGNLKGNIRLEAEDVIIVGTYDCLVNITGKVKRPMYYEMKDTESVATIINYAGGFTGDAFQDNVRLIRKTGGEYSIYSLNKLERSNFKLNDGDSLSVDSALSRFRNMVEIKGAVFRAGMYQMDGNVNTVRGLIEIAGGIREDAFTNRAVMHRLRPDRSLEVLSIDLKGILENRVADVALHNEDVLFVPSIKDSQDEFMLSIYGEVQNPGVYHFASNTTLEDLILQAGGLKDAASLVKVDISRRIRNKNATASSNEIAESFSFSIKDGFVVDGEPGFVLKPFDEVFVRKSPGYIEQEHVTIKGEVQFEGMYVIDKKALRLSDLVKNAGGISNEAYVEGARLERKLTEDEKIKRAQMMKLISNVDTLDYKKIETGETRYIGIQLDKAIKNPGGQWDIVLEDGDILFIPQYKNVVTVNGEVMYPNTVSYQEGKKLSHYINQAGGFSNKAKKRSAFAVNMNGTVTKLKKRTKIQPGCEILVPAKRERRGLRIGEILSLGTMTATLGTVIATLVK